MLGYPGSGKTTVAKMIHELTGATHLWADYARKQLFSNPTHPRDETRKLYAHLQQQVAELLAANKSVVFDANFNFYRDRMRYRRLAHRYGAAYRLIWVKTPKQTAKERATSLLASSPPGSNHDTRVFGDMPVSEFEKKYRNLQPPRENEPYIEIDGTNVSPTLLKKAI